MFWFVWAQFVFAVTGKFQGHVSKDSFFKRVGTFSRIIFTEAGGQTFIAGLVRQVHNQQAAAAEKQLEASNRATRRANAPRHKKAGKR